MTAEAGRNFALDLAEHLHGLGKVAVRRFFGGTALVIDGLQIGFVMKGALYLRVDDLSRASYEALGARPFTYAGAGRRVTVARYFEAPAAVVDDPDSLCDWAKEAHRAAASDRNTPRANRGSPAKKKKRRAS